MEPTGPRETAADIERAAADWVARQDRGPLSQGEQQELEHWAAADSRRAGAYARAMAINLHLDRVAALGEDFAARPEPIEEPSRRRFVAVAAGGVAACAAGLGVFAFTQRQAPALSRPIATAKGAVRELALREGSRVTLNTMTQVRPALTSSVRRIDLIEGEALFDVAKDPNRPFVVDAGDFSVRAVGTSFTVRRTGTDAIKVVVTEGIVKSAARTRSSGASMPGSRSR
jgi:transmembrane sensor